MTANRVAGKNKVLGIYTNYLLKLEHIYILNRLETKKKGFKYCTRFLLDWVIVLAGSWRQTLTVDPRKKIERDGNLLLFSDKSNSCIVHQSLNYLYHLALLNIYNYISSTSGWRWKVGTTHNRWAFPLQTYVKTVVVSLKKVLANSMSLNERKDTRLRSKGWVNQGQPMISIRWLLLRSIDTWWLRSPESLHLRRDLARILISVWRTYLG